jgi:hypothetical protein
MDRSRRRRPGAERGASGEAPAPDDAVGPAGQQGFVRDGQRPDRPLSGFGIVAELCRFRIHIANPCGYAGRHREPAAADPRAVMAHLVRPDDLHRPVRRAMRGQCIGHRRHPGKERLPRLRQRPVGFEHDREGEKAGPPHHQKRRRAVGRRPRDGGGKDVVLRHDMGRTGRRQAQRAQGVGHRSGGSFPARPGVAPPPVPCA